MSDKIYVKGLRGFKPHDKSPDFVLGSVILTIEELREFFNEQKAEVAEYNGKHQLKADVLRSKDGGLTFQLNTYKKKEELPPVKPVQETESELPF